MTVNWHLSLPAADTEVPCGTGTHTVRWSAGQLSLPAHPDTEAELVLGALGGDKPACVTIAETWRGHADDLAVLAIGPRRAADRVSVGWQQVAEQRAALPPRLARALAVPSVAVPTVSAAGAGLTRLTVPGTAPGMPEPLRRFRHRIELLELFALGPGFQFRLAGTVSAAWAGPDRAEDRAGRRAELAAALTGRFAPAAAAWLGIDPGAVTVTPHEGPGWGTLAVTGAGPGLRLRASLPVSWLASAWACGLAVADGHLVVAVEEPGYPRARVLALAAPDARPTAIEVHAEGGGPAGLPAWTRG